MTFANAATTIDITTITITERRLVVTDPFATRDGRARLDAECERLAQIGRTHFGTDGITRKRTSRIDRSNPATAEMLDRYVAFAAWLDLIPSAAALDVVYDPTSAALPNGVVLDDESRLWFANVADGVGIRSRAHVLAGILRAESLRVTGRRQRWLSLGSGAIHPVIGVLGAIRAEAATVPELTLRDLDREALSLARDYAYRAGVSAQLRIRRANVLRRRPVTPGRADVVEAVGLLEYLKPHDWALRAAGFVRPRRRLAGAVTFLRNAYELVAPGGVLVVGNMLDTHPQLGFTLDVVQWPHIQPRSVAQMRALFAAAGIAGEIEVTLPSDGVYAVYTIRRPA
ncbi:hypothetical protein HQQ81_01300 [Microbacteriaceae bacterium VKM Ac-2854]|nr:hypothetical protein [Microbacteriaceae bacterium VKM Ac-2854]